MCVVNALFANMYPKNRNLKKATAFLSICPILIKNLKIFQIPGLKFHKHDCISEENISDFFFSNKLPTSTLPTYSAHVLDHTISIAKKRLNNVEYNAVQFGEDFWTMTPIQGKRGRQNIILQVRIIGKDYRRQSLKERGLPTTNQRT